MCPSFSLGVPSRVIEGWNAISPDVRLALFINPEIEVNLVIAVDQVLDLIDQFSDETPYQNIMKSTSIIE
jgi:hypothetical protein